jgi:heme exporter protein D
MENDIRQAKQRESDDLERSVAAFDATNPSSSSYERPDNKASEPSAMSSIVDVIERNPLIALAAAASLTAIVVIALKPSRQPKSQFRSLEKRAIRQARQTERQLKSAFNRMSVPNGIENLVGAVTTRLSSLDASRLDELREQAMSMLNRTVQKIRG